MPRFDSSSGRTVSERKARIVKNAQQRQQKIALQLNPSYCSICYNLLISLPDPLSAVTGCTLTTDMLLFYLSDAAGILEVEFLRLSADLLPLLLPAPYLPLTILIKLSDFSRAS